MRFSYSLLGILRMGGADGEVINHLEDFCPSPRAIEVSVMMRQLRWSCNILVVNTGKGLFA